MGNWEIAVPTASHPTYCIFTNDDIVITGDGEEKEFLDKHLNKEFEMKQLGKLKYFLLIEVTPSKQCFFISQLK